MLTMYSKQSLKRVLFSVVAFFIFNASNCDTDVTEVDSDGKPKAWWISVTVTDDLPSGYKSYYQTDADGKKLNSVNVSLTEGSDGQYSGDEKDYSVRVINHDQCDDPCGYLRAYICPLSLKNCAVEQAAHDFGIVKVTSFDLEI